MVSAEDRTALETCVRAPTTEQRLVERARIVLLAAEGWASRAIAREVTSPGCSLAHNVSTSVICHQNEIARTALVLITTGTASADMAAGRFFCDADSGEIDWRAAAPADAVNFDGDCGPLGACSTTPDDFLELLESLGCKGAIEGAGVASVCVGNRNQLNRVIGNLCEATFP